MACAFALKPANDPRLTSLLGSLVFSTEQRGYLPKTAFADVTDKQGFGRGLCRGERALVAEMRGSESARLTPEAARDLGRRILAGCHVRIFTAGDGRRFALVYEPAPYPAPIEDGATVRRGKAKLVVCHAPVGVSAADEARRCLKR